MEKHQAVFGAYRTSKEADFAVGVLTKAGFKPWNISVLAPTQKAMKSFKHQLKTTIPVGVGIGAVLGFIIGIVLMQQAFSWVDYPILFMILGGVMCGFFGAACGALVGIGTPERVRYRYLGYVKGGNVLMSVETENKSAVEKAHKILEATGAQDISDNEDVEKTWKVVLHQ